MPPVIPPSLALDGMAMASPNHDVSCRGGDVGPHRHLEDQTDHLLFFCQRNTTLTLLGRFAARAGFVALRQTFVRRCQNCLPWVAVIMRWGATGWLRAVLQSLENPGGARMRTFSGCNNCRSRASRPDTSSSWG